MDTTTRTGTPLHQRMTEDLRMRKLKDKIQQACGPSAAPASACPARRVRRARWRCCRSAGSSTSSARTPRWPPETPRSRQDARATWPRRRRPGARACARPACPSFQSATPVHRPGAGPHVARVFIHLSGESAKSAQHRASAGFPQTLPGSTAVSGLMACARGSRACDLGRSRAARCASNRPGCRLPPYAHRCGDTLGGHGAYDRPLRCDEFTAASKDLPRRGQRRGDHRRRHLPRQVSRR